MLNRMYGLLMCTAVLGACVTGVYLPPTDRHFYLLLSSILAAWVVADGLERDIPIPAIFSWAFGSILLAPLVIPRWYATRRLKPGESRRGGMDANFFKAFGIVTLIYTGMSSALNFVNFGSNNGFELIINSGFAAAGTAFVLCLVSRKESVTETGPAVAADGGKLAEAEIAARRRQSDPRD